MKSFIAIPLVLAGVTAEAASAAIPGDIMTRLQNVNGVFPEANESDRRRTGGECNDYMKCKPCAAEDACFFNLRVGRCVDKADRTPHVKYAMTADDCPDALPKFDLEAGATCAPGYEPLTSRWEDCAAAARTMGFKGDAVKYVKYNKPWGTTRPEGCFRKGNGEFHFNDGAGGNFKGRDRILCVLEGKGPRNPNEAAGSSLESSIVIDTSVEAAGPEGAAPRSLLDLDEETNGGMLQHAMETPLGNDTAPIEADTYKYYSKEEGWTKELPVSRSVCGGSDERYRISHTSSAPWKWIVDLVIKGPDDNYYQCTGFFISKRAIMTAGHCLRHYSGWVKQVKVCPGRNGGNDPYGCQYGNYIWTTGQWYNDRNMEYDYGTISLPDTSMYDKGIGYFGFTTGLSDVVGVNIAGYPGDKDSGTTLWWNYDDHYTTRTRMLEYMADTGEGMSGGPVWAYYYADQQRRIVGIHSSGGCPNAAVRVTQEVFDWMMGFRNDYN